MDLTHDEKERVRQAVDIVDLVGSYLELRRAGRVFKALCPWHDDRNPSLQVNPDRQTYKCWVCGEGGDVFSFVQKYEGLSFPEALKLLAERAGVTLTPRTGPKPSGPRDPSEDKTVLLDCMSWAEQVFHDCLLHSPAAEAARHYLDDRGVSEPSLVRFRLGYAPDQWDFLLKQAGAKFSPKILEKAGLVVPRANQSGHYDRFKGRVLFPIRDLRGRAIALGGRILPELAGANPAKYINSPESLLFSKSRTLYGLDLARVSIGQKKEVLITEGYLDCLMAQQFGLENTVAVLGTALTEEHLKLLQRVVQGVRIVLVLDGDAAGQKRTDDLLKLFFAHEIDLRVLTLPDELDPCEFLLDFGAVAFQQLLDQAPDALEQEFLRHQAAASAGPHQATTALEKILSDLAYAPRLREGSAAGLRMRIDAFLTRVAQGFRVDERVLRDRLNELRKQVQERTRPPEKISPEEKLPELPPWEREFWEIFLVNPECFALVAGQSLTQSFTSKLLREAWAWCERSSAAGQPPDLNGLLAEFDDPACKRLLVDLAERGSEKERRLESEGRAYDWRLRLQALLANYEQQKQQANWSQLRQTFARPDLNEHDKDDAFLAFLAQKRAQQEKPSS